MRLHGDFLTYFYGKAPSYGKIWGELNYLWGKDKHVTVHHLAKNAYIFHIPSPSLRRRILQHELWHVGDSPFFVIEWKSVFSLNPPSLDRAPVWAKINGIPFDLITDEGLSVIFSPLGRVVDAKPFTSISSSEVKVIVDLTKRLPPELELECEDGRILMLSVTYPWLPPLCRIYNEITLMLQLKRTLPQVVQLVMGEIFQLVTGKRVGKTFNQRRSIRKANPKERRFIQIIQFLFLVMGQLNIHKM